MAIIIKALGAGTVTVTGTSDLYTVPSLKSAIANSVRLVNGTTAVTTAMELYVKPSAGTARRIWKKGFTLAAKQSLVVDDLVTLAQGDKIQVFITAGASPTLGFMINGLERG